MSLSRPDTAYVDTIDACHLKCPTCPKGLRAIPNSGRKMPLGMFKRIVDKLNAAGYRKISLYNWTEPFLNRSIEVYIGHVKSVGLFCELSTTLSMRHIDNLEAALVAGVDRIIVSISGFDQTIYQINHVGGKIEYVIANLHKIRSLLDQHGLTPQVIVKMIRFEYNSCDESKLRSLAEGLCLDFQVIDGMGDPERPKRRDDEYYEHIISKSGPSDTPETRGQVCGLLFDQITIDVAGDVHLCCAFPTFATLRIGSYLEMSDDEILLRRYQHPLCRVCSMPRRPASAADGERIALAMLRRFPRNPEVTQMLEPDEVAAMQAKIQAMANSTQAMIADRHEMENSIADRDRRIQAMANSTQAMIADRHEMENSIADRDRRIQAMANSTSWKLVSPLWRLETRSQRKARRRTVSPNESNC